MVAFSRRPIVLSSREEELLSTRLLDHLSLVATTSPHDRTASAFIQFLQIGSKKQSVWFTPFVRAKSVSCLWVCLCLSYYRRECLVIVVCVVLSVWMSHLGNGGVSKYYSPMTAWNAQSPDHIPTCYPTVHLTVCLSILISHSSASLTRPSFT